MNKKKILIIFPGNRIKANEAWNKEIREISTLIPSIVLTTGDITGVYKKKGNYIVIRDYFILYPLFGILTFILSCKYDTALLECSPRTIYFNLLVKLIRKNKIIYRIKSYSWIDPDESMSKRLYQEIKDFRGIVVDSKKMYKEVSKHLPSKKIFKITPGINLEKYSYSAPPRISNSFKILFASAPLSHHKYPEIFKLKGIDILLKSIKYYNESLNCNIKLYILWRDAYILEIKKEINQMGLREDVKVINETVNMVDYYKKCHATVFPATSTKHSPDFPSSIMESLSVGRPVIVSNVLEISDIIEKTDSGVTCEPNEIDLAIAIQDLIRNYKYFQKNCRDTARSNFCLRKKHYLAQKYN